MPLIKKLKTASNVLKTRGLKGVFSILKAKFDRSYRPDETQILFDLLKSANQSGLMIDVGAHHGSSLAPFARAGWQVIAFEPDSNNRNILTTTFGTFENVIIDPRACSDHNQPAATLFASTESTGVSGLSAFLNSHEASETVPVTTLAAALQDYGLTANAIDFLKIDTEGFDLMVLQGFPWDAAPHPRVILCEFENAKTIPLGYDIHQLAAFLVDRNYQLVISEWYPIKAYGEMHRWRRFSAYPCQLADPKGWGNILAVNDQALYLQLSELFNLK
ncbi:MAG: FkbM family methyltransferase [Brevefilum sp.]